MNKQTIIVTVGAAKKKTSDRYNCSLQHGIGRLSILFLVCLSSIGYYYCQDTPAALEEIIIEVMEVDVTEYSLLYTLYSTPNILTGLVIGILTDKVLGLRTTYIAMLIVVCLGAVSDWNRLYSEPVLDNGAGKICVGSWSTICNAHC